MGNNHDVLDLHLDGFSINAIACIKLGTFIQLHTALMEKTSELIL